MKILGIRCSNNDFSFAVVSGNKKTPHLLETGLVPYPKGYTTPESLKWFLQELEALNARHSIDGWAIKGAEPMAAKGKTYAARVEFEAMVSLSAANAGSSNVVRKVKSTIAKDLGLQGKAKALITDLDYSLIDGLKKMDDKNFESVVVAWSALE